MRKIILLLFLFVCGHFAICAEPQSAHLKQLIKKYPYALLGDDHGILSGDDLAISACTGEPSSVTSGNMAYPYWQCFHSKDASFEWYDADEKSVMAIMAIAVRADHESNEYLSPRAIRMSNCRRFRKDWARLTDGQEFFCVSGQMIKYQKLDKPGHQESTWVFDRLKTKRGCTSYFQGDCSLKHQLKDRCFLPKK
jgi:hypothetical protein